ncbi:Nuclear receptor subfamily 2 group F member 5 [Cyphomyrmex costatus]|uniref:Nuclear receptor subfamily 2 group F member 5 n=1 Tax=Cyphomyrmex costatus TaxID=456900 RepID=A0A195CQ76_9HYME|nr:Nuclear receptor subfamily 2 group F member 5 [Cyphomyrmex costatus]
MPPAHLTPSATPEDITCLVPAGSVLTSRDPLPPSTTPGSQANSSQSGSSQTDKSPNIECVVCGDKSSGKHYGQFTCEERNGSGEGKGRKKKRRNPGLMRGRKRQLRMIEEGSEQNEEIQYANDFYPFTFLSRTLFHPLHVLANYKTKLFWHNYVDNGVCNGNGMSEDKFRETIKNNSHGKLACFTIFKMDKQK